MQYSRAEVRSSSLSPTIARGHDERHAIFVQTEYLVVVGPRRRGKSLAVGDAFLGIDLGACLGIEGGEETLIVEHVDLVAVEERRRIVRPSHFGAPHDVF